MDNANGARVSPLNEDDPPRPAPLWALVPVRGFAEGKQRLAGVLCADERRALCRMMLEDVLAVLCGHPLIQRVVLVSSDAEVADVAARRGIDCWAEAALGASGLNPVINAAARHLQARGAQTLMVVHADLPLLSTDAISGLIRQHWRAQPPAVTIAPDLRGEGSNIVLATPPAAMEFRFGPHSFARRRDSAAGVAVGAFFCQDTGADIDTPADLEALLLRDVPGKRSLDYLRQSGVADRLRSSRHPRQGISNRQENR